MATLADSLVSSSSRPLALRKRPDLTAREHRYQGRAYWVVKEPVGLKYYRFHEEEYAVLQMLDGRTSLDEIRTRFQERFAPQKITLTDLQQFIGMLHRSGLVYASARGQGEQLKWRGDEQKRKERLALLSNVLAIRFKGIDPERLLNWLYPKVRWFFSPVTVVLCCLLGLSAIALVATQFDVFRSRLPAFQEFFGPENWIYLGMTMAVVKIMHEFGHGLSCKHFGGECHEIGIMMLVLTPCLYCNVSDSWMLPNKWRRAAIGAAGMYVELVLASIATFVWWYSVPSGMLSNLSLRVILICSVSTVMFNGNPLLRYDGYYILADLVEIPNLRQKATSILNRIMAQWCLGIEVPEAPYLPQRNHLFFALFTIASVIYRWIVLLSILWFLNRVFEPIGLKIVGQAIATVSIASLIGMPLYQFYKFISVPGRVDQMKARNVLATVAVLIAVITGILLIPVPRHVYCALDIRPADSESVYIEIPCVLEEVFVKPGQQVKSGELLARLSSVDLRLQLAQLEGDQAQYRARLDSLRRAQKDSEQINNLSSEQIPQVEEALTSLEGRLKEKRRDLERLELKAPTAGSVIPPQHRDPPPQPENALPQWSGSLLDERNRGVALTETVPFCEIGDPERLEAEMIVDQSDITLVKQGQPVEIVLDAYPHHLFHGKVASISNSELKTVPRSLSIQAGGEVATQTDEAGMAHPLSTSYTVRVPIETDGRKLWIGLRGRAKINTGQATVGTRLWRYLLHTFHFKL